MTSFFEYCKRFTFEIVSLGLFFLTLPLVRLMTFPQNDDWVYYVMVKGFLLGNLTLDPISAPTFYSQGLLGAVFAKYFSLQALPIMTLVVSVATFYTFSRVLYDQLKLDRLSSLLMGLLLFFNPLFLYSIFGFMTENYFLFFFIAAIYFTLSGRHLLGHLFMIIGFFLRQVMFALPLSLSLYYLYTRKYRKALYEGLFFLVLYGYYTFLFPKTPEMFEKKLEFAHFAQPDYVYALFIGVLAYLGALILPVFFAALIKGFKRQKSTQLIFYVILSLASYFLVKATFNPHLLAWGEFPFLDNTFERTGFYARGIGGTKYQFKGIYDLYYYWELAAMLLVATALPLLIRFRHKIVNEFSAFMLVYFGVLVLAQKVYDRYLLLMFMAFMLFGAKLLKGFDPLSKTLLFFFVLFLVLLGYQFSSDFVLTNKYVWDRSEQLVLETQTERGDIQGTNAWKLLYPGATDGYTYDFSYDSPEVNEGYSCCYKLIEQHTVTFPGSLFINSKVYLYEKN